MAEVEPTPGPEEPTPVLIIVMGVAGTGKTTLARALSTALGFPYIEGDELHPPANIAKMAAGHPLTDADREPWLALLRTAAEHLVAEQHAAAEHHPAPGAPAPAPYRPGVLVTCSALRHYYRDILRGTHGAAGPDAPLWTGPALQTCFVFIRGTRALLLERVAQRQGHYMKANMVDSQLATLEDPEGEEGVVVVDMQDVTSVQLEHALAGLEALVGEL
ncbi:P-loop containing nucleoside triphosphate hydrolase protein [Amylocystis lapponica]|nr:P-loop containing nucleoside triphosphate hydrolase protein [Amylocystis lapponica]